MAGWEAILQDGADETDPEIRVFYIGISVGLVILAGLMSGLTLGLMSMDQVDLEVLIRSGTPQEKKYAERIAPVLKRPHLLLVTLLLVNAAAMEALPIFLDRLVSPTIAIILSVTAVLFFGEIIPQALCTRYGLAIGAYSAWFVRALMWAVGVVSWPISKVLDYLLGSEHGALFRRAQLKALVDIHSEASGLGGGYLSTEEIAIIRGALDMTEKKAFVGMTPLDKVFMMPADRELNTATMRQILGSGHSRVPVHRPGNRRDLLGLVLVKELALIDLDTGVRMGDVKMRALPVLRADTAMYDLLTLFQTGRSHMVVLTAPPAASLSRPRTPPASLDGAGAHAPADSAEEGVAASIQELKAASTPPRRRANGVVSTSEDGGLQGACMVGGSEGTAPGQKGLTDPEGGGAPLPECSGAAVAEAEPVGIITIEDVLEELLQHEIVDETDQYIDNMRLQKVNATLLLRNLPPHLRNLVVTRTHGRAAPGSSAAAAKAALLRQAQAGPAPQGLHSVRSENLDGNTAAASMRRSKTAPRALPTLEEPLLLPEENGSRATGSDLV